MLGRMISAEATVLLDMIEVIYKKFYNLNDRLIAVWNHNKDQVRVANNDLLKESLHAIEVEIKIKRIR